ncbi:MAG: tetratricopeptide repeat protein [Burkholderiaceae bacterium]|nr:tetratricopeptide repeat protein [Burkholderiaceae bacterium]
MPASSLSLSDLMAQADILQQQGQAADAIILYQSWLAEKNDPLQLVAWFNLGVLLGNVGRSGEAQVAYQEALKFNPQFFQARLNLGHQLENQGHIDLAIKEWLQVLNDLEKSEQPEKVLHLHAINNLARSLESARRFDEAESYMVRSLQIDPDQSAVLQHCIHIRQKQCKWPIYQPIEGVSVNQQLMATSTLAMLAAYDDPALQLLTAREFVHAKVQPTVPRRPLRSRSPGSKIRIGYLSGDLCMHAVGLLTVELFELHNREKFEVFAFCWSREDGSPLRERIIKSFDYHIRIGHLDDLSASRLIESCSIDILIDLQGLTAGARPNILVQRPAPVQISYLGLPGTSGIPAVDYILADPFVFPEDLEPFMTEKPLRVPNCYQVSDRKRAVGRLMTRTECGLPEDKFVFAAFNNNYKFTEDVFSVWMRILSKVDDSVLWILSDNPWAKANMTSKALEYGIGADRLIFSDRAAPEEYMARLKLPDLFLDTFPYNAGTTANDILWMGTPILTCSGKTYISRMCGSLLNSLGLHDLIANSMSDYEDKAVRLGKNIRAINMYKKYIEDYKVSSNLFDIPRLVRDLEYVFCELIYN